MHETILRSKEINKCTKINSFDDSTVIYNAKFRFGNDIADTGNSSLARCPRHSSHLYRSVIFNVNFCTCFLTDFTDDFATGANNIANLINRNFQGGNLWCAISKIITGGGKSFAHFIKNMDSAFTRLIKCNLHNFRCDRRDFNIHLQRCHTCC